MKSKYAITDPVVLAIRIPSELRKRAHVLGLSMSKICRNALEREVRYQEFLRALPEKHDPEVV